MNVVLAAVSKNKLFTREILTPCQCDSSLPGRYCPPTNAMWDLEGSMHRAP